MDGCLAVEREVEKVLTKFGDIDRHTRTSLEELLLHVQGISRELQNSPDQHDLSAAQSLLLTQSVKQIKDTMNRMSSQHKELHGSVSKVGKAIDRNFVSDFNSVLMEGIVPSEERTCTINSVVGEHFLRQGMLDIVDSLVQESGVEMEDTQKEPFLELHGILESLKFRDLAPALAWARMNAGRLEAQNSSLEFKLHRLQFINLIQQGPGAQQEALLYSRNFAPFAHLHAKELQVLMGSLLYIKQGLANSPYTYLLDPVQYEEICDVFTRDACSMLGLSIESPLSVVVRAGCNALPPLLNIRQVMQQRQCSGVWSAKDELPVEIDIGADCRFHSIFACPILRQQSSNTNPPVRLVCGHVISRDALNKLNNSNKSVGRRKRVKCPYCPMEQSPGDARQIHF